MIKRIALILGIVLVVLLAAAFALPLIFKDDIIAMAKKQINENVNAVVGFDDVSISLFRAFPNICLAVDNLSVIGVDEFEGVPLAKAESMDLTLDLWSVLRRNGPIELRAINMHRPDINVYILRDGTANYDIALETDTTAADTTNFDIELQRYSITEGNLLYDDRSADTRVVIRNLNHSGSGNFTRDVFDLVTETTIDSLSVSYGGIAYLRNANASLDATLNINQPDLKYTLRDNILTINDFQAKGDGFVQLLGDSLDVYNMDLHVEAPQNDFKSLFSLIPNAYIQGYENVKASGQFRFAADIKGEYDAKKEAYPSFKVDLAVDNGSVKYPDLPLGISDIHANALVNSPTSNLDDLVLDVSRFNVKVGKNPFSARLNLKTPISDPDIDAFVKGTINLKELQQAYPMEGMESLAGVIKADMEAKTRMSYIEQKAYDQVKVRGNMSLTGFRYQAEGLPLVVINQAGMDFTPEQVRVNDFDARLGRSDIQASGTIDNFLAYISPKKTMTGRLALRSGYFDVNEWYGDEETPETAINDTTTAAGYEVFDRFNFQVDAKAGRVDYLSYHLANVYAQGRIAPNRMDISDGFAQLGDSDFRVNGTITNAFDYSFDNGVVGGHLNLSSRRLNLNEFMGGEPETESPSATTASTEDLEPILVPDRINMAIDADIEEVVYTNMTLRDVNGVLRIADQAVLLENVSGNSLGGKLGLEGGYDTRDAKNPGFSMKVDVQKADFQEAFNTLNTFQKLAPIAKFIDGTFNTTLIMDGTLSPDLMPRLNSLNAQGFLQTLDAVVRNFKPLQEVGQKLNVQELAEAWNIENTKNWFEVKDGMVEIKPFDTKVKDIPMTISGRHGIDQKMDYNIKASIPRQLLRKSGTVGQTAERGLQLLQGQASKLGIDIAKGEYVNVLVNLTGSVTQPKVNVKLLGTGGQNDIAESAEGELKQEVREQIEKGKEAVREKGKEALDTARAIVKERVEQVKEEAKKQVQEAVKEQGKEAEKVIREGAKEAVGNVIDSTKAKSAEQIKKELEKFNPFKKKKETKRDTTKSN